jgi:hypothetical protein
LVHIVGRTKNKILGCIFSEKVHFENGKAPAPSFTPPIEVLMNASKVLGSNKIEKEVISDLLSTCAPPIGKSYKFDSMISYSILLKSKK